MNNINTKRNFRDKMITLLKAMINGYLPTTINGSLTTMPVDFLIDKNGIIKVAHYGQDEGDHLDFEKIKSFSVNSSK